MTPLWPLQFRCRKKSCTAQVVGLRVQDLRLGLRVQCLGSGVDLEVQGSYELQQIEVITFNEKPTTSLNKVLGLESYCSRSFLIPVLNCQVGFNDRMANFPSGPAETVIISGFHTTVPENPEPGEVPESTGLNPKPLTCERHEPQPYTLKGDVVVFFLGLLIRASGNALAKLCGEGLRFRLLNPQCPNAEQRL